MVALALGAAEGAAAAEPEVLAGAGRYGWGTYRVAGDLGAELGGTWMTWELGGELRVGRLGLGVGFDAFVLESLAPELHGDSVGGFALGGDARYFGGPPFGLRWYGRLGLRRAWLSGGGTVERTCSQTGTCDGGFYAEAPRYRGAVVKLGGGLELLFETPARDGFLVALFVDVGYDRWSLDVIERPRSADVATFFVGTTIGGGRLGGAR